MTAEPCTCRWLERAAAEPHVPIVYDERLNEFQLTHIYDDGRIGSSRIRHCPWCGRAAPESKRGAFFAEITSAEDDRLRKELSGLKTVDDVIAKLGPPDEDHPEGYGSGSAGTETDPPTRTRYRLLRYTGLSETANVTFIDFGPGVGVRISLEGKYLGKPKA